MSVGFSFGGRCFSSSADVADAYFSSLPPTLTAGATSYYAQFTKVGAVWNLQQYTIGSAGTWVSIYSTAAQVPAFGSCAPEQPFLDGMAVGWGIVAAMAVAWAAKTVRRQAR